ncbi:MAG: hypothetical protein PHW69_06520 [Elusimicrobiaceae bacterium]|nr:hypothetical protein [Elusimicrobiaceae bacterium]
MASNRTYSLPVKLAIGLLCLGTGFGVGWLSRSAWQKRPDVPPQAVGALRRQAISKAVKSGSDRYEFTTTFMPPMGQQ